MIVVWMGLAYVLGISVGVAMLDRLERRLPGGPDDPARPLADVSTLPTDASVRARAA